MLIEKMQPIVDWKEYLVPTNKNKRVQRFLDSRGVDVFGGLVASISEAVDMKVDKLHVMVHPNVTSIVIVKPHHYMEILNHSLNFFKEKEEYELCAETVSIIEKVKKFRTKKIENMKKMVDEIQNDDPKD